MAAGLWLSSELLMAVGFKVVGACWLLLRAGSASSVVSCACRSFHSFVPHMT